MHTILNYSVSYSFNLQCKQKPNPLQPEHSQAIFHTISEISKSTRRYARQFELIAAIHFSKISFPLGNAANHASVPSLSYVKRRKNQRKEEKRKKNWIVELMTISFLPIIYAAGSYYQVGGIPIAFASKCASRVAESHDLLRFHMSPYFVTSYFF